MRRPSVFAHPVCEPARNIVPRDFDGVDHEPLDEVEVFEEGAELWEVGEEERREFGFAHDSLCGSAAILSSMPRQTSGCTSYHSRPLR